jgi:hypothetical protein
LILTSATVPKADIPAYRSEKPLRPHHVDLPVDLMLVDRWPKSLDLPKMLRCALTSALVKLNRSARHCRERQHWAVRDRLNFSLMRNAAGQH